MLVELKSKSQITIPKNIVNSMKLNRGDKFEVVENSGKIILVPVVTYPKEKVEELEKEINEIKENMKAGKQPIFDTVDEMFKELDKLCID